MLAISLTYFIPFFVLASLLLMVLALALLSRVRGGRYALPVVRGLQKVPYVKGWMQRASQTALEKQNPDLASAMKKLERAGVTRDPMRAQQALSQLTPAERRAYMEEAEKQGIIEGAPVGRAERRRLERMQKGMKRR